MSRLRKLINIGDDFISILFPRLCQGCGESLVRNEYMICMNCIIDMPFTNFDNVSENNLEKELWGRCYIERAAAMCFYRHGNKVQHMIHRLKYVGVKNLGFYLGKMYAARLLNSSFLEGIDIIIPVPLHPSKLRQRGFNQSEVIAKGLASVTNHPVSCNIMARTSKSATQTRKTRVERWENVEGIFELLTPETIGNKHVLLVDDVITTGATIEACVNTLKRAENVKVSVVAIAAAVQ